MTLNTPHITGLSGEKFIRPPEILSFAGSVLKEGFGPNIRLIILLCVPSFVKHCQAYWLHSVLQDISL